MAKAHPPLIVDLTNPSDENVMTMAQIVAMLAEVRNYGVELFHFPGHGAVLVVTDVALGLRVQEALEKLGIVERVPSSPPAEAN